MKIHSKFNDYYDTAMAYGVDDHVHWVRNVKEIRVGGPTCLPAQRMLELNGNHRKIDHIPNHEFIDTDMFKERPGGWSRRWRSGHVISLETPDHEPVFVGFCGKIYCGIQFTWEPQGFCAEKVVRTAYDTVDIVKILREFDKVFKTNNTKKFIEDKNVDMSSWNKLTSFNETALTNYFKKYDNAEFIDYFVDLKTPVFAVTNAEGCPMITVNPILLDYDFQKVMDSFTAYQEIEMFMGGVLAELDEINVPGIDDKHLAAGKGFDKWSFKTMPTKHKKREK